MRRLAVHRLTKTFGGVVAVDDVSFEVGAAEILALIGPNGAGKSTCFNLINGQIRPSGGSVTLDGVELVGRAPREIWRLGVGRTFQITATFASMSVVENVQVALFSHHRRARSFWPPASRLFRDEAYDLLEQVGMAQQARRPCGILAYGDLKRVELAVALANRPGILLMDEPTAGMAPKERLALMALIREIMAHRDMSVLFTEHDMDIVFSYAHRIIVLNRGRIVAAGAPQEVRDDRLVKEIYLGAGTFSPRGDHRGTA
jgi:branched-chain amino acid transport system ATP-binding protein